MAFGWDDALFAIFTSIASAGASSAFAPDAPTNEFGAGAPEGTGDPGAFELPNPVPTQTPGETVSDTGETLDLGAQQAVTESLAQVLAAQGPPPQVPLQPAQPPIGTPGSPVQGPPAPGAGPQAPQATPASATEAPPNIGEILLSSPDALAGVANLLGLGPQEERRETAAPIPGGSVGNLVPGFNLPQTNNIGQLLAQIPGLG